MAPSVPSPEDFIASFPEQPPKIMGAPSFESLSHMRDILKANAASVHSLLGGGQNGYLGLVVSDEVYATISPTPFIVPGNPGVQPIIPQGTTAAITAIIVRNHEEAQRSWREYNNLHLALKKQIVNALEPLFLRSLKDRNVGFNNVTLRDMLTLLFRNYGQLTPIDLKENNDRMNTAWDPSTPFELLIDQIEESIQIADAGEQPYTQPQILNTAYSLIFNTGLFFDDCKVWNAKPPIDKNWPHFKTHFMEANRQLRMQQRTAQQAGYHAANAAYYPPSANQQLFDDTAEALANLATAAATDRQAFSQLTNTIAQLTEQIKEKDALIVKLQKAPAGRQRNNANYCWTHGYLVGKSHTSATCKNKAQGHKDDATAKNNMGGNQIGKN